MSGTPASRPISPRTGMRSTTSTSSMRCQPMIRSPLLETLRFFVSGKGVNPVRAAATLRDPP